ncbi:hypothetical protein Y032_0612g650 [Ancylostoma ceylanicum]|uniref:Uncharacterized protein n=1 Tax=Ancylostoma ceylanicum TaxID=53326 RepID=A0A016WMB9_9BILA|nr:hypothetical protein Y032_0612g650 [Ancylostoma ceylanicum]
MPPYHAVGANFKCFPTIRRRHTLITLLDPSQGVSPLLNVSISLSHRWTRLQAFSRFESRRTLITPLLVSTLL